MTNKSAPPRPAPAEATGSRPSVQLAGQPSAATPHLVSDMKPTVVAQQALAWAAGADISARSALVTILGDTIAPLGGTVWLADLIALAGTFGFNERLVRTSMFRLASERWVTSERIGRKSRYSLTDFGRAEFSEAENRIYQRNSADWDGRWTLVLTSGNGGTDDELTRHLQWRGFAEVSRGVYATPHCDPAGVEQLFTHLNLDPHPLMATACFRQDDLLTGSDAFRTDSGLAEAEAAYHEFVERYERLDHDPDHGPQVDTSATATNGDDPRLNLSPQDAFALRTMVIHDLRRARLRDPELPAALMTPDWIGHQAFNLAASLYQTTNESSWRWVETVTGSTPDPETTHLTQRFAGAHHPPDHQDHR